MNKKRTSFALGSALSFIVLMGIVSLFSDLTHEGATSIMGSYLSLAGASAASIGFISGFGELIGHSLRLATGFLADRTKKYWFLTILGYVMDLFAIPLLALVPRGGFQWALALILFQKMGKAIKKPAKDTILSFAAKKEGVGKSFALQEALDQLGAFLGSLMVFGVMHFYEEGGDNFLTFRKAFFYLGVPALLTLSLLVFAMFRFPHPESFEEDEKEKEKKAAINRPAMFYYLLGIGFFAAGFIDYSLISMHLLKEGFFAIKYLPLVYSFAMLVDALAALFFGWYYDRVGMGSLIFSTALSAFFSLPLFLSSSLSMNILGIALWGIGMGTQEAVMKAVVSQLVPKASRSSGFGVFQTVFGIAWFLGSWLMGSLYTSHRWMMILFSCGSQLLAVLFFWKSHGARERSLRNS